jgi:hypothetical protein
MERFHGSLLLGQCARSGEIKGRWSLTPTMCPVVQDACPIVLSRGGGSRAAASTASAATGSPEDARTELVEVVSVGRGRHRPDRDLDLGPVLVLKHHHRSRPHLAESRQAYRGARGSPGGRSLHAHRRRARPVHGRRRQPRHARRLRHDLGGVRRRPRAIRVSERARRRGCLLEQTYPARLRIAARRDRRAGGRRRR